MYLHTVHTYMDPCIVFDAGIDWVEKVCYLERCLCFAVALYGRAGPERGVAGEATGPLHDNWSNRRTDFKNKKTKQMQLGIVAGSCSGSSSFIGERDTVPLRNCPGCINGVCITSSGRLHKSAIVHIPGSKRPAGMPGSHKMRLETSFCLA